MEGTNFAMLIVTFLIVLFSFMVMGTGLVFGQERSLYPGEVKLLPAVETTISVDGHSKKQYSNRNKE